MAYLTKLQSAIASHYAVSAMFRLLTVLIMIAFFWVVALPLLVIATDWAMAAVAALGILMSFAFAYLTVPIDTSVLMPPIDRRDDARGNPVSRAKPVR